MQTHICAKLSRTCKKCVLLNAKYEKQAFNKIGTIWQNSFNFYKFYGMLNQFLCAKYSVRRFAWPAQKNTFKRSVAYQLAHNWVPQFVAQGCAQYLARKLSAQFYAPSGFQRSIISDKLCAMCKVYCYGWKLILTVVAVQSQSLGWV